MLWSPLLFALVMEASSHSQNITHSSASAKDRATSHTWGSSQHREQDDPSLLRPRIHYCRSPNMETFTCWWHFPDNGSHSNDNITYTLTYSVGKGRMRECPDYVTGGPNSCYFDSRHTQVWEIYCMKLVAHCSHGNYTSEEHCLDVADIVETDPPFNLTYWLTNSSGEGAGCSALVSWLYPNAADVHVGWVTLDFELQYRRKSEPHSWKAKGVQREPQLELLDLPAGSYVVRVRCKSHNSRLWSKWSELLTLNIPSHQTIDKMLAVILVIGISIVAFLMIGLGIIPNGKRIKAFLLPPVPKPRIRGIDPTLLKNGRMDEITRLFKSFHGYSPPQYSSESWLHVTTEEEPSLQGCHLSKVSEKAGEFTPSTLCPGSPVDLETPQGSSPYCQVPSQAPGPTGGPTCAWPWSAGLLPIPSLGYTVPPAPPPGLDFYACVNGVNTSGAVQLVPCVSARVRSTPLLQVTDSAEKGKAKPRASGGGVPSGVGGTGSSGGGVTCCYTTMDDLQQGRDWPVDGATAQGDGQGERLSTEQGQIPATSLSAETQGFEP
ncbi:prolactin receptor-like [Conger conger]|uniref:prolactin receptor-like n=1 Tax=Conger conger TaxID=82655 RepID=UPI002A5A1DB8|nr:prolactin receptor-like [Conger conger]